MFIVKLDKVIKDEKDMIVIGSSHTFRNICWFGLILFIILSILLHPTRPEIVNLLVGGIIMGMVIYITQGNHSVTIDRKLRIVVIIKNFNIEFLTSREEIPFSNINRIEIESVTDEDGDHYWRTNLITIQGKSKLRYYARCESDAETLAEKIHKMTGKEISRIVT